MGCGTCGTGGGGCTPAGCKSNGSCLTGGGCSKLDVNDWLANMAHPSDYKPFNIIEVRFKGSRKDFFINEHNLYIEIGEALAVETGTGGYDLGHVSALGEMTRLQMKKKGVLDKRTDFKKIYRKANASDVEKWRAAKILETEVMYRARTIAMSMGLNMKLSDVEYQGDKTKATFFYTAEERVDFRELIKVLADEFKIKIEMRQIGIRQEASRLGGIGSCGRELCCSTWLTDFKAVNTAAARYQNLSINTQKLAGQCGKLKCCLNYELDTYMDALKGFPTDIRELHTQKGSARLQKTDIFKRIMWFGYKLESDWIPLTVEKVLEIAEKNKGGVLPDDLSDFMIIKPITVEDKTDYMNVVGQDSLTRLDNKNRNKNRSNNSNNNRNKPSGSTQNTNRQGSGSNTGNRPNVNTNRNANAPIDAPRNPNTQLEGNENTPANSQNRNSTQRRNNNNNRNNNRPRGDNNNAGQAPKAE